MDILHNNSLTTIEFLRQITTPEIGRSLTQSNTKELHLDETC